MCKLLKISRICYYKLLKLKQNVVDVKIVEEELRINERIKAIYNSSRLIYESKKSVHV